MHQVEGTAGTVSWSSSQSTLSAADVGTKEIGLIESVCENSEMSYFFWSPTEKQSVSSPWTVLTVWLLTQGLTCTCVRKVVPLT